MIVDGVAIAPARESVAETHRFKTIEEKERVVEAELKQLAAVSAPPAVALDIGHIDFSSLQISLPKFSDFHSKKKNPKPLPSEKTAAQIAAQKFHRSATAAKTVFGDDR